MQFLPDTSKHFLTKVSRSLANSGKELEMCLVGVKRLRCKVETFSLVRHPRCTATQIWICNLFKVPYLGKEEFDV